VTAKHPSEYPHYDGPNQAKFFQYELDWVIGVHNYVVEQVEDWARRHAEHAGHAPLSELHKILRGDES
jgi:hypothetical protein